MVGRRHSDDARDESAILSLAEMAGPYCRSKLLAEQAALAAARRGLPVVVVNPTAVIGPGDRTGTPPSAMLRLFMPGGPRLILDCTLNFVDVRDVADGILLAAEAGRTGERYTLGGTNIRLSDLAARIDRLAGRPPRTRYGIPGLLALAAAHVDEWWSDHVSGRPPTAPVTGVRLAIAGGGFDCSKAVAELGYAPRPFDESLADALAWLGRTAPATRTAVEILAGEEEGRLRSAR